MGVGPSAGTCIYTSVSMAGRTLDTVSYRNRCLKQMAFSHVRGLHPLSTGNHRRARQPMNAQ
jgi:hypothetical protein